MKPKIVKIETKKYEANDGRIFDSQKQCLQHEIEDILARYEARTLTFKNFELNLLGIRHETYGWHLEIEIGGDISLNLGAFYAKLQPKVYVSLNMSEPVITHLTFKFFPDEDFDIAEFLKKIDDYQSDLKKQEKIEALAITLKNTFSGTFFGNNYENKTPTSWQKFKEEFPESANAWHGVAKKLINKEITY
jgi:hypothetical protein